MNGYCPHAAVGASRRAVKTPNDYVPGPAERERERSGPSPSPPLAIVECAGYWKAWVNGDTLCLWCREPPRLTDTPLSFSQLELDNGSLGTADKISHALLITRFHSDIAYLTECPQFCWNAFLLENVPLSLYVREICANIAHIKQRSPLRWRYITFPVGTAALSPKKKEF
ncbi:hypothetical protein J6590_016820 [Homalodisca vitripennis]|nr:hypothetical protein J6590_016820 [Homalodisca vitripennis]